MISSKLLMDVSLIVLFETIGQIFVKTYYEQDDRKLYLLFLGWLMYLPVVYFLFKAYFSSNFALANGLWNAVGTVLVALIGWFYYKEKLTKVEMIGLGLIILGFVVIGMFSDGGARDAAKDNN